MTTARPEIAVGLIGYGLAGEFFHAPLISATRGMRLAAVVTANAERAARAAKAHPTARILASADLLWERSRELGLIVIATPNSAHVPLAEQALAAGLAVVVDKPFTPTAADARRLAHIAKHKGLLLTVYQNRRWDGDFLTLQHLLQNGRLGTVHRFESRFERWRPVPKPGWRQDPDPQSAGGVLYDLGSHLIDQALVLFGAASHVYAELDGRTGRTEVDDDAFVALTHVSGTRSHLWMSSAAPQLGPRFRVLGSRAGYMKHGVDVQEAALRTGARPDHADWGEEPPELSGVLGAGENAEVVPTRRGAYPEFYRRVVLAMQGSGPAPVDPLEAAAVIMVIEAARMSAHAGQVVSLERGTDRSLT